METILHQTRSITEAGMVILIWLVQLIIYPAFRDIPAEGFVAWHEDYTKKITFIVLPLMIGQAIATVLQVANFYSIERLVELICIAIAWIVTFSLSVPCHKKLHIKGKDAQIIDRLIATNWVRTIAWTAAAIVFLATSLNHKMVTI